MNLLAYQARAWGFVVCVICSACASSGGGSEGGGTAGAVAGTAGRTAGTGGKPASSAGMTGTPTAGISGGGMAGSGGNVGGAGSGGAGNGARDGGAGDNRDAKTSPDASAPSSDTAKAGRAFVYIGSGFYTPMPNEVRVFELDRATGALAPVQTLPSDSSPSIITLDRAHKRLFVNIESSTAAAAAYSIEGATGKLTKLNQVANGQDSSAYITVDGTGRYLMQANYNSGTVSVLSVKADGMIDAVVDTKTHGKDTFPHCIRVDPSNAFVFVPNRSGQSITQYKLDAATGKLTANTPAEVKTPAGTGPRHLDFHPRLPIVYVVNETKNTVTVYKFDRDKGTLSALQDVSTLPDGFTTGSAADMHVHPSGMFLYSANRGHSSLAMFTIDETTGMLTSLGQALTGGKGPRNFSIDPSGAWIVAGNLESSDVTVFAVDRTTGKLTPTATRTPVPSPSGVLVAEQP